MNFHFDNLHSPSELRILSAALAQIADDRERAMDQFRLQPVGAITGGSVNAQALLGQQFQAQEAPAEAPKPRRPRKSTSAETAAADASSQPTAEEAPAAAPEKTVAESSPTVAPAAPAQPASTAATELTLVDVRAKLAALSQAGKAAQVKGLLGNFGVAKLTDVPAEQYGELMAAAEAI